MKNQKIRRIYTTLALIVLAGLNAHAQDSIQDRDHLLGDWGGFRSMWEEKGLLVELVYTAEYMENVNGGIKKGGDYRGDVSLFFELDTKTAGWWDNGEFFVHVQQQHGDGITERYAGDFQVLSNIDADDFLQISEVWYRHNFIDNKLWLKLGKQESNADFAYVDFGGEFINSSAGFHPTIPLVTYPDQDWGVVVGMEPNERFSMNLGIYQGRPDGGQSLDNTLEKLYGPMFMIEPVIHYKLDSKPGSVHIGYWHNGDEIERLDGSGSTDGTDGYYLSLNQVVYQENEDDDQGIGFFAQYASSDEKYIEADSYYGAGIEWIGAIDSRDEDAFGLAVYHVDLSSDGGFDNDSETTYELFYKFHVTPWCSIKPDFQYIVNPGGTNNKDATVLGIRTEITF